MASRRTGLTFGTVASHLGVLVAVSAVIGVLVAGLAIPMVSALGFGAHAVDSSLRTLPQALQTEPLAQRTRVLDAHGKVIATFYDQNRVNVSLDDVAPIMRRAIVAIEDYRFYEHGALDLKGTLRAFLTNQTSSSVQGGSSITQQMAKMTAVEQAQTPAERKAATADTYQRKIDELRHAIAFEQNHTKDWILERYLNIAYFGDGAYGVQSAAKHYFGVDAKDLDLQQASLLAGLVKNPVGYEPTRFPERSKARRKVVLDRMAQLHVISKARAEKVEAKGLGLHVHTFSNGCVSSRAAFFCDYVRRYLLADPALGKTVDDRSQLLNAGGLTIRTTVDLRFQRSADRAVGNGVHATDQAIGAMAMVQPGTGNVRALAQSRPMGRHKGKGQTFLNYTVPAKYGDAAGFQPGSTFKLFVLATALDQGLPPSTSYFAPDQVHIPQDRFRTCDGPYPNLAPWEPHNSTLSNQTMDMYVAMQQSVNTYFAQLERTTGLCQPFTLANELGASLHDPEHQQVPSFTLGVADESPLTMAAAYATMPARGVYCAPRPVTTILNSNGDVFKAYPKDCHRAVPAPVADRVNDILKGVMLPGGFGAGLALDKASAGKTGTSQDNKAVWFNGYTPQLSTSTVVAGANREGHPMSLNSIPIGGVYHGTAHGSTVAGPIWADAMRGIQDLLPADDFHAPAAPPDQAGVPTVSGQSIDEASAIVKSAGFDPQVAGEVSSAFAPGTVAQASLGADGKTVYLYTSTGDSAPAPAPAPAPQPRPSRSAPPRHHAAPPPPSGGGTGGGGTSGGGTGNGHGHGHKPKH
ncbi:MAG: transglycosylase domain-containing protein [Marmoricola sp.]